MTNRNLVQRFNAVQQAIQRNAFHTTKINYALSQNHKRLERALQGFQEMEEELREEYSELLEVAQEIRKEADQPQSVEFPDALPEKEQRERWTEYQDRRDDLLDIEADEEIEPYQVETEYLFEHEEGADAQWLTMLDWMIVEDVE